MDAMSGALLKVIAVKDHVDADDLQKAIGHFKEQQSKSFTNIQTQSIDGGMQAAIESHATRTISLTSVLGEKHIGGHFLFHRNPTLKIHDQTEIQTRMMQTFDDSLSSIDHQNRNDCETTQCQHQQSETYQINVVLVQNKRGTHSRRNPQGLNSDPHSICRTILIMTIPDDQVNAFHQSV